MKEKKVNDNILRLICDKEVIPAPRCLDDFKFALTKTDAVSVILLFADINSLPGMLAMAQQEKKRVVIHLDLLEGIGKDKAGIRWLARIGVTALITTKSHLGKIAREEGMIVIQRLFLVDSEAVKTGINMLRGFKPDILEVLPASAPARVIEELIQAAGLPILGGGLVRTKEDVCNALGNGISAVSASRRELWAERYTIPVKSM
ncbi:MAG TPA: glycerol-3-phosphate responsive antiterminator [Patescibacteria group bacterium]|nr:glycerol-3-phosphate responsive antiterminator [Patescibacteria group bacterium]